ncbi:MAG: protein phosphatase 2C domain-containing protein, partial [bacterium]
MQAGTMTTASASFRARSSGKSRKGGGRYNWDYICSVEFSQGAAVAGVYAVADGSPSPTRGDLASEIAVETLKEYFQRVSSRNSIRVDAGMLRECAGEINETLLKKSIATAEDESERQYFHVSLSAGCIAGNTFHACHCGNTSIYVIEDGKISRLTEKHPARVPEEPPAGGAPPPGILGWDAVNYRVDFISHPVKEDSVFILCTDGVSERIGNLALLETWLETRSPEAAAGRLMEKLESRGAGEDASVVIVHAAPAEERGDRFVKPIRYPLPVIVKKNALVLTLLAVLGTFTFFRETIMRWTFPGAAPAGETADAGARGQAAPPSQPETIGEPMTIFITTRPSDALVFLDGARVGGESPVKIEIAAGDAAVLRIEREGFVPYSEEIRGRAGESYSRMITLKKVKPEYGSLRIVCDRPCDAISLDGASLKTSYPRSLLIVKQVSPGEHTVTASSGGAGARKRVNVRPGEETGLSFDFAPAEKEEKRTLPAVAFAEKGAAAPVREEAAAPAPPRAERTA